MNVIIRIADQFTVRGSDGIKLKGLPNKKFAIVTKDGGVTPGELGYVPSAAFPRELLDICPSAPSCSDAEYQSLIASSYWGAL